MTEKLLQQKMLPLHWNMQKKFLPVISSAQLLDEDFVQEVEVTGKHDLIIRLGEPSPIFIEELFSISIIPKHIWQEVDEPEAFTGPESLSWYRSLSANQL